jgi:hypothetical protein
VITDNRKYEKGSLGWLREQQKIKAKKDGFDNIDDWLKWKADHFNILERKYGEEFTDWARKNECRIPKYWIDAGCKTIKEYKEFLAKRSGFDSDKDRVREWMHDTGRCLPKEDNPYCSAWFSYIGEYYVMKTFEDPIPTLYGNPGFDWKCKKGEKIDHKGSCLHTYRGWTGWQFTVRWNNTADYFILSAWDNRYSLNPMHVWMFHKSDIVRGKEFWKRDTLYITNTTNGLKQFEKHEVTDKLDKLKELCNNER